MNLLQRGMLHLSRKGIFNHISDKNYLKFSYWCGFLKKLDLEQPKTFNEKLQWLKLYDRRPEYTTMVDKYEVKKYVSKIIGEKYIIPTIGVWDRFDDIDFDKLPNQFVLKCTHDSGGLVICSDKNRLDIEIAKKKIEKSLNSNYFWQGREWPYKNVKPRIIAEEYKVDESGCELKDYKFFCFDGEPKMMFVASSRAIDTRFDFFDMDYKLLPFTNGHPHADLTPVKPAGFEEMKTLSAILSKGIPHVRVDFYDINGHVYFGEMTFYHWSGLVPFEPAEWDYKIGSYLKLPEKKF